MTLNTLQVSALAALLLAGAGLCYQHEQSARQADTIGTLKRDASLAQGVIEVQGNALASIQQLQGEIASITSATRATRQALDAQSAAISQSLEELKRNDQTIRSYLDSPVPAAIGVRWQRAESVDPITYRTGGVRVDPVPSAGASRPGQ
jgi:hypothetical protein